MGQFVDGNFDGFATYYDSNGLKHHGSFKLSANKRNSPKRGKSIYMMAKIKPRFAKLTKL